MTLFYNGKQEQILTTRVYQQRIDSSYKIKFSIVRFGEVLFQTLQM